jgi:hypothetical protein
MVVLGARFFSFWIWAEGFKDGITGLQRGRE